MVLCHILNKQEKDQCPGMHRSLKSVLYSGSPVAYKLPRGY